MFRFFHLDEVSHEFRQYETRRQDGGPEQLRLDEAKPPDVAQGQIRVHVRAAAANPMDWKIRRGLLHRRV
jgi:NADPH:quinone reductase-like Zn-dependent oxidoreductase